MEYFLKYDLEFAKQQVSDLDRFRTIRALSGASEEFQHVFQLISLLLHFNTPHLPGYIPDAPTGICNFELSPYHQNYLNSLPMDKAASLLLSERQADIHGVYSMGSISSITQTASSDIDIWICHRADLSAVQLQLLEQKAEALKAWAKGQDVEINFFPMDQNRFRCFRYADQMSAENCGSAQYMLLLDEFYRSVIRLAGKPLLWMHLLVTNEKDYEAEVTRLIGEKIIDPEQWVDFGGLGSFSANEYFGASLWQLYKGIDAPYKAAIKILLLESYSWEYPNTHLIACDFKYHLLTDRTENHLFDPYLAMLERTTAYLLHQKDFKRLEFIRRCFYIKATEDLWYNPKPSWRLDMLADLVRSWQWSPALVEELNHRPLWKIKQVKAAYDSLVRVMMLSYRHLVQFARKHKVNASIAPKDISILTRKLYIAFEELPGKVTLLNPQISIDLSEPHLTFIEVEKGGSSALKPGWYVVNRAPSIDEMGQSRYTEYNPNLHKLVAWAYFNGLLTANTELHIFSANISQETLREFVTDLRLFFPVSVPPATNEELNHPCEIRQLIVAVNLVSDPTKNLLQQKGSLQQRDLFNFGPEEENLVGSIDLIYRNLWNEVRTLHFTGQNAILLALKVLSNKIYQGAASPKSVHVVCYSQHYRRALRNIVAILVNKCISIQLGTSQPSHTNNLLRVAGKNWAFFFEERGISLQEIDEVSAPQERALDSALHRNIEEKTPQPPQSPPPTTSTDSASKRYPAEIDSFASEGFLQFFFEDNPDGSFNVYLLDEANRIEIYRNCDGVKEQKIREINRIYNASGIDRNNNPYKIIQRDFNYPQFYRLTEEGRETRISLFQSNGTE
ncbi:adenylate cyclase [Mesocricetibacter intestinalis]|uniref:Adenylate cyclase n=1 Tax=Mesocricetibacter intestinalis TaxID=1521930 RepID=A0A4R6V840_9PAST|nr:adenylate cyclase [Mesocricetibacter intestinalis]